ncbi:MAG TPA: ChbG/HpnK family deacetylase [Terriglobales bacterium]|nr:ChbG/HpnK family deacetylase [Terriglobales bacterium]
MNNQTLPLSGMRLVSPVIRDACPPRPVRYNERVRRLIVNADDFGLTSGVNRAILEAHQSGVVTSATLMANAAAFPQAIELARSAPELGLGCHVVLVDGAPLSNASQVSSLLHNGNAQFHESLARFAVLALRKRLDAEQIEREVTAQIRKIQSAGITVSHLDTHKHTHMFPSVLKPILRAAQKCGIAAIRNPFETVRLAHLVENPGSWKRWLEVRTLHRWAAQFHREVEAAGVATPDGTIGIVATGALGERWLKFLLQNLPEGTWELVCHPGYNDGGLQAVRTRLRAAREQELEALTSRDIRQVLSRRGVELISYRALARGVIRP